MHIYRYIHFAWEENKMLSSPQRAILLCVDLTSISWLSILFVLSLWSRTDLVRLGGAKSFITSEPGPHQRGAKQAVFCNSRLLTLKFYPLVHLEQPISHQKTHKNPPGRAAVSISPLESLRSQPVSPFLNKRTCALFALRFLVFLRQESNNEHGSHWLGVSDVP